MPYLGNVPSSFNVGTYNIDNGAVTTEKIADGAVVNADVNASAAIAGTKISPDFGSQNLLTTGTATAASLIPTSSTAPTNGFFLPAANTVGISTNGSGRLFINSSGDIGLGTNSPDVFGRFYARTIGLSSSGSTAIQINSATGSTAIIDFGVNSSRTGGITSNVSRTALSTLTASPLVFETDSSERFRITSAGLVGIGTNSPSNDLDILKTASGSTTTARIGATATTGANNATLILNNGGTGNATLRFDYEGSTNRASIGVLASDQKLTFGTAGSTAMTIDASQRLGIGTTSPASTLSVGGNAPLAGAIGAVCSAGGIALSLSDNVNSSLHVRTANGGAIIGTDGGGVLRFATNGVATTDECARLMASGQWLLGTTTAVGSSNAIVIKGKSGAFNASIYLGNTANASTLIAGNTLGFIEYGSADGGVGAQVLAAADATWSSTSDCPTRLVFSTTADGASSPTERMRITNSGELLINRTTRDAAVGTGCQLQVLGTNGEWATVIRNNNASPFGLRIVHDTDANGTGNSFINCVGNATQRASIRSNGGLANFQANNADLSDLNSKKDISPASSTWNCIKHWEIVNYRYKDQPDTDDLNIGVIAQQVAQNCPEVVTVFQEYKEATEDQPAQEEQLGVKAQQMHWMAIKALQEAQVRIEQLEAKVAALESA